MRIEYRPLSSIVAAKDWAHGLNSFDLKFRVSNKRKLWKQGHIKKAQFHANVTNNRYWPKTKCNSSIGIWRKIFNKLRCFALRNSQNTYPTAAPLSKSMTVAASNIWKEHGCNRREITTAPDTAMLLAACGVTSTSYSGNLQTQKK